MKTAPAPRIVALVLIPAVLVLAGRWLRAAPPPSGKVLPTRIIDVHCHTAGIGAGGSGCFVSDAMRRSYKLDWYLRAFGTSRAELEEKGDAVVIDHIAARLAQSEHVDRAVVLALDGCVDTRGELDRARTEIYVPNEFVAAEVAKHPNLLFGASVNPYRHDALERLSWAKAHGAVLVKWLPSVQQIDPADPALIPFYRQLVALRLPLLSHTGSEHAFTGATDAWCDPERLRLPLSEGVTVIAAHAGTTGRFAGEPSFDRLAGLMREYPNLYADVSSLTQVNKHGDLESVFQRPEFAGRLIYGTDYPLVSIPVLVSPWYYPIRLGFHACRAIANVQNPWDGDVALKSALGAPPDVWTRANTLLVLPAEPRRQEGEAVTLSRRASQGH